MVGFGRAPAARAGQPGVQGQFQSVLARGFQQPRAIEFTLIHAHVTEYVRGQGLVRVHPQLVIHQIGENRFGPQIPIERPRGQRKFGFIHAEGELAHRGLDLLPRFHRYFAF